MQPPRTFLAPPFRKSQNMGTFFKCSILLPNPCDAQQQNLIFPKTVKPAAQTYQTFGAIWRRRNRQGTLSHIWQKSREFRRIPYCIARFEGKIERFRVKGSIPEYMYTPERDNRQTAFHAAVSRLPAKSYFPKNVRFFGADHQPQCFPSNRLPQTPTAPNFNILAAFVGFRQRPAAPQTILAKSIRDNFRTA